MYLIQITRTTKYLKSLYIPFIVVMMVCSLMSGCNFFETRQPDEPTGDATLLIPPTTPDIVITNFIGAIESKNVENYKQCFTTTNFSFTPATECNAQFPSFFDEWTVDDEQFFMLSLSTRLGSDNNVIFTLQTSTFETISNDSAVLITNYTLEHEPTPSIQYATQYEGRAVFTIVPTTGGLWAIKRWQDFSLTNSSKETFSYLKVHLL